MSHVQLASHKCITMPSAASSVLSMFAVHCATWFMQRLYLTNLLRLLQSLLLVVGPGPLSMLDAHHTTVSLSELISCHVVEQYVALQDQEAAAEASVPALWPHLLRGVHFKVSYTPCYCTGKCRSYLLYCICQRAVAEESKRSLVSAKSACLRGG